MIRRAPLWAQGAGFSLGQSGGAALSGAGSLGERGPRPGSAWVTGLTTRVALDSCRPDEGDDISNKEAALEFTRPKNNRKSGSSQIQREPHHLAVFPALCGVVLQAAMLRPP